MDRAPGATSASVELAEAVGGDGSADVPITGKRGKACTGEGGTEAAATVDAVTTGLLQIKAETLVHIIFLAPLTHNSLAHFLKMKCVSRTFHALVHDTLRSRVDYNRALHRLALFVRDTQIPCGAATVLPVPRPGNWSEVDDIFKKSKCKAPHGIEVGGIFSFGCGFFLESNEVESIGEIHMFMLLVECHMDRAGIFSSGLESTGYADIANVLGVPNNVRSAFGLLDSKVPYSSVVECDMALYSRFLYVRGDNTMGEVFDAIRHVEGWNSPIFNMRFADDQIEADVTVQESSEMHDGEQWRLEITWPPLDIDVPHDTTLSVLDALYTTTVMHQGLMSETGAAAGGEGGMEGGMEAAAGDEGDDEGRGEGELAYDHVTRQWTYV